MFPCPVEGCTGTCTYDDATCTDGHEIEWVPITAEELDGKLPDQNGGYKPIRPGGV